MMMLIRYSILQKYKRFIVDFPSLHILPVSQIRLEENHDSGAGAQW